MMNISSWIFNMVVNAKDKEGEPLREPEKALGEIQN